jgi:hypothetical protein
MASLSPWSQWHWNPVIRENFAKFFRGSSSSGSALGSERTNALYSDRISPERARFNTLARSDQVVQFWLHSRRTSTNASEVDYKVIRVAANHHIYWSSVLIHFSGAQALEII